MSFVLSDFDESVHDMIRVPSLLKQLKTKLIQTQFPDPLLRTGAFILDVLDSEDSILCDAERSDILFYLCCE